jgi:hypothetical protein
VQNLAFIVFPDLEDDGIDFVSYPTYSAVLLRHIGPLVEPVGFRKELLYFFKANAASGIRPQPFAFASIEMEPHWYNSYITLSNGISVFSCRTLDEKRASNSLNTTLMLIRMA